MSLKDLRAEKSGTRVAEIVIASPVLGLRPGAGWSCCKKLLSRNSPQLLIVLTFPVKYLLQAANRHKGRVILTNLATIPEYQ